MPVQKTLLFVLYLFFLVTFFSCKNPESNENSEPEKAVKKLFKEYQEKGPRSASAMVRVRTNHRLG